MKQLEKEGWTTAAASTQAFAEMRGGLKAELDHVARCYTFDGTHPGAEQGEGDNMKETCDQCGAGFERLEARHVCDGLFYLFSSGKLTGVRDQVHDQETTYCAACYYECYAAGGDER